MKNENMKTQLSYISCENCSMMLNNKKNNEK